VVGDQIRVRILATDVSLAREPPGRSRLKSAQRMRSTRMKSWRPWQAFAATIGLEEAHRAHTQSSSAATQPWSLVWHQVI